MKKRKLVLDWTLKRKGTKKYLGPGGELIDEGVKALFYTCPRQPYVRASVIKQAIFAQTGRDDFREEDFVVGSGYRERYEDVEG